jgi:nucleotide-binding universal stress UspA family protein
MDLSPELDTLGGMRKELSRRHQMRMVNKFLSAMMKCRREMTLDEIDSVKDAFGQAAFRAKEAGFDMVELHGATGYLLVQFLSPRSNRRIDRYGGSLENRMRFPLEVVSTVKSYVGDDFPIGYRFLADEWIEGGFGIDEAEVFAGELERAGIAYLSATAGTYESFFLPEIMNKCRQEGYLRPLAKRLKASLSRLPVIIAGRIIGPDLAEVILQEAESDLIGMARSLFCDPYWPNKVLTGNLDQITACKGCRTCLMRAVNNEPVICSRWNKLERMDLGVGLKSKRDKWKQILILMDDSQQSMEAVSYAGHMIGADKTVTLFSLVKNDSDAETTQKEREGLLAHASKLLQEAGIRPENVTTKVEISQKSVEQDILQEIRAGGYGSVIMGRRGVSKTRQFFFGSISNYIVHHAKDCSVWVVD